MDPQEQQAILVITALHQDHKERKQGTVWSTEAQETPSQSSFNVSQIVSCLYAFQLPGQKLKAGCLKHILNKELADGSTCYVNSFIDYLLAWTKLPFQVDNDLLEKLQ